MLRAIGAALHVWLIVLRVRFSRATLGRVRNRRRSAAMSIPIRDEIRREVLSWPGVTEEPHRFGGVEFRFGKRELGHLHGNYLADLPFPVRVCEELVR